MLDLVFKLAFRPSGVADEAPDKMASVERFEGGPDGQVGFAIEGSQVGIPAQGRKGQFVRGHGPADEHIDVAECAQILVGEKIGHALSRGPIQDVPECTVLFRMGRHEDHRFGEIGIIQRWGREEECSLERMRGAVRFRHVCGTRGSSRNQGDH